MHIFALIVQVTSIFFRFYLYNSIIISYFAPHLLKNTLKTQNSENSKSNKKITIMSEIQSKVVAIIVDKLGVDESEVKPEASFTNDLGADSLDTVELIMEFEKEFGVSIPDDKAEKIATVGDAISYIENAK